MNLLYYVRNALQQLVVSYSLNSDKLYDRNNIIDMHHELVEVLSSYLVHKSMWFMNASTLQCIENEKQNKIIQSQSAGVPVELDSQFIRYSTFRTGKEQLVSESI